MNQLLAKLSVKEKIGYSLGDVASCIFFQSFILFLLYFYTDVFGISAAAAGTMFLFTRIWDSINDPIMGVIADRTNTKWGKFRPYLLWIAVPFGIIGFLTFTTPDLSNSGKLIYAYVTYCTMMMAYTAINIPYTALLGVVTSSSLERTSLSSYKFVGAFLGCMLVQAFTFPLVENLGAERSSIVTASIADSTISVQEVGSGNCKMILTAKDAQNNTAREDFIFKVYKAGMRPPIVVSPLQDVTLAQGFGVHEVDLANLFADEDGDDITYSVSLDNQNAVKSLSSGTSLRLEEQGIGNAKITVTADDGNYGATNSSFSVSVLANGNHAPVQNTPVADITLEKSSAKKKRLLSFLAKNNSVVYEENIADLFYDEDGDLLNYSVRVENESIVSAEMQESLLKLHANKPGGTKVILTARDNKGGQVSGSFFVQVRTDGLNSPIVYQPLQNIDVSEGFGRHQVNIASVFRDLDGDQLNYSLKMVDETKGFSYTFLLYAIAAIVLFILSFLSTKERVQPLSSQKTSLKHDVLDLTKNGPWIVLLFVGLFNLGWISIRLGSIIYYFKYYAGSEVLSATFLTVATVANILGAISTKWMATLLGKKKLFMILMLANAILVFLFYIPRPDELWLMYLIYMPGAFLSGPTSPLIWAMYADTADYSEYMTGRRATGLVFSAATFAQKMGWTIGGSMAAWLLAYFGYEANVSQTTEALHGIKLMVSVIPAVVCAFAAVAILFYKLDESQMQEIETELVARRTRAETAQAFKLDQIIE